GIVFDGYNGANETGTVSNNTVDRMGGDGLFVTDGASGSSLAKTRVENNTFDSEHDDGIHVEKQNAFPLTRLTKNTFTGNTASSTRVDDCHDSNTRDVWRRSTNTGRRVSKGGLCSPGDVVIGPQNHRSI